MMCRAKAYVVHVQFKYDIQDYVSACEVKDGTIQVRVLGPRIYITVWLRYVLSATGRTIYIRMT